MSGWWLSHPSEKHDFVSWGYYPNVWKNKKCSKPPNNDDKQSKKGVAFSKQNLAHGETVIPFHKYDIQPRRDHHMNRFNTKPG
jgi:hypothetical protein